MNEISQFHPRRIIYTTIPGIVVRCFKVVNNRKIKLVGNVKRQINLRWHIVQLQITKRSKKKRTSKEF